MTDALGLVALAIGVLVAAVRTARRDLAIAGFLAFFLVYSVIALTGYRFVPIVSMVQGLYFGPERFRPALVFTGASFAALLVGLRVLRPVAESGRRTVRWAPQAAPFATVVLAGGALAVLMALRLAMLWPDIAYGRIPQIPDKAYTFVFKYLPSLVLVFWAIARLPGRGTFERALLRSVLVGLGVVFLATAIRAGNRTDILALTLALLLFEVGLVWTAADGTLMLPDWRRLLRTGVTVGAGLGLMLTIASFIQRTRVTDEPELLPPAYKVFVNDYYAPAHMLVAAMALDYVKPLAVLASNLSNSLLLGGVLGVPYLQQDLGNAIAPGSSSRSTGFAFFIFAEGYIAAGWGGIVYNGLVTALGLLWWRRQGRTDDPHYNALVLALTAMQWAVVARSGTHLLVRNFIFTLLPMLALFRFATGCRLRRQEESWNS